MSPTGICAVLGPIGHLRPGPFAFFDARVSRLDGPLLFAIRVTAIIPRPMRLLLALPYV